MRLTLMCSDKGIQSLWRLQLDSFNIRADCRWTIPALLTEAALFARQFPEQLPELGERELAVVVVIQ